MSDLEYTMLNEARDRHGLVFPCSGRPSWEACFTRISEDILLWYNTPDGSTHLVKGSDRAESCNRESTTSFMQS